MSKIQLKKELLGMSVQQITDMVLELYSARPEAKEYLDFFIKPDIDAKLEKARTLIKKELNRNSRGRNRARSSRIRRFIKDISSLNPGMEAVCEIMTFTIETVCATGSDQWIKETTQCAFAKLIHDTLTTADSSGLLHIFLPRLETAIQKIPTSQYHSRSLKQLLNDTLSDTLQSL